MKTVRFIFSDQLSHAISSLSDIDSTDDFVFLCETREEATYVKHHKKKLIFLWSAQRHFAAELKKKGIKVIYTLYDDKDNAHSVAGEIKRIIKKTRAQRLIFTHPGEHRQLTYMHELEKNFSIQCEIRPDDRFFSSPEEFAVWAGKKKQLRMEFFYRVMRKKHKILMTESGAPCGGKWNFDVQNRERWSGNFKSFKRPTPLNDAITKKVITLVENNFSDHFGDSRPFTFAVTRSGALKHLHYFIKECLAKFGAYQDVMVHGDSFVYHSVISLYLNAGLLLPREVCQQVEEAFRDKKAPLNAVEGFIRQILGWREFIRGIYWLKMPRYKTLNYFKADKELPWFYWTGNTQMRCIAEVIRQTKENAYSHHIQRLMITGNFALIAGIDPNEVCEWYLIVYADAFDWVELPNTRGMALFADGGLVGSKPYAASANYINKMSNFCDGCVYDPKKVIGEKACPFNALYWNFLSKHKDKLSKNPRLAFAYSAWNSMDQEKKRAILERAKKLLKNCEKL